MRWSRNCSSIRTNSGIPWIPASTTLQSKLKRPFRDAGLLQVFRPYQRMWRNAPDLPTDVDTRCHVVAFGWEGGGGERGTSTNAGTWESARLWASRRHEKMQRVQETREVLAAAICIGEAKLACDTACLHSALFVLDTCECLTRSEVLNASEVHSPKR